jgi:UDP-N-acetylglucosamine 2-epimerase (non-hydrolysing)
MIKTLNILGARPNYMKVAPLQRLMLKDWAFKPVLVHTGQHYG